MAKIKNLILQNLSNEYGMPKGTVSMWIKNSPVQLSEAETIFVQESPEKMKELEIENEI